jgi:hypothetical protein
MKRLLGIVKSKIVNTNFGKKLQQKYGSQSRLINSDASNIDGVKLNLACGNLHIPGYVNIDSSDYCTPDLVSMTQDITTHFEPESISNITIIHGLGYLSFDEAITFFSDAFDLLLPGCELVIETPCLSKMAQQIVSSESDLTVEPELIFPIFATSKSGPTHGDCYQFAWTQTLLGAELLNAGFKSVRAEAPLTHGQKSDRDMRIIATK